MKCSHRNRKYLPMKRIADAWGNLITPNALDFKRKAVAF